MNKWLLMKIGFVAACACAGGVQSDAPEGMKERANMRNLRYGEVLVVMRHGLSATAFGL